MKKAKGLWSKSFKAGNLYLPIQRADWVDITQLPQQWQLWRELVLARARDELLHEEDSSEEEKEEKEDE